MDTDTAIVVSRTSLNAPTSQEIHTMKTDDKDVHTRGKDAVRAIDKNVDRGYAWVVLAAVVATTTLDSVMATSMTLLYQAYLINFQLTATSAGLVLSVMAATRMLSSPIFGQLYQKFTFRTVAMAGSVSYSLGVLLIGFASGLPMLYAGNILVALGSGSVVVSSLSVLSFYFDRRRGMAMAVSMSGYNIGFMLFPPLVTRSFNYFGYTQTVIFMACVITQLLVTTSLFRPKAASPNAPVTTPRTSQSKWQTFKHGSGLALLKKPVLLHMMLIVAITYVLFSIGLIYTSGLAIECADMSSYEIATTLSIEGFCEFAKLGFGVLFDLQIVRPHRLLLFCFTTLVVGILGIILTFTFTMVSFTIVYVMYSVLLTSLLAQSVTVVGDLVDLNDLPKVMTFNRGITGIILLVLPPLVGRLKDVLDSFQIGFIFVQLVAIALVLSFGVLYCCKYKDSLKRSDKKEYSPNVDELCKESSPS